MYRIEETSYGFKLRASGTMDSTEADLLRTEFIHILSHQKRPFSLVVDIRGLVPTEVEVLDFAHRYTHEDPFPLQAAPLVNDSFDAVFSRAAARLA